MSGWPTVRLKYCARINASALPEDTDPCHEFRYIDIGCVEHGGLVSPPELVRFGEAPSRARRIAMVGDTIVSTVRTYLRATMMIQPEHQGVIVSTGFAVLSPLRSRVEPRFLARVVESNLFIDDVVARSVGVSYPAINPTELGNIQVPLPRREVQVAIADYLDRETASIDLMIAAKRSMIALLRERFEAHVEDVLRRLAHTHSWLEMKRMVADIVVGIVVTPSAWYAETGVPALRGVNIRPGSVVLDDLVFITEAGHRLHRKSALRVGDLVTVRTGQAGATAIVPPSLHEANCVDLLITRVDGRADAQFLELVLNSGWAAKHIGAYSVGAIQSHFNVQALKALPIPRVPVDVQHKVADTMNRERRVVEETTLRLSRQVTLLRERRQALITAAVTGQLGIAAAA